MASPLIYIYPVGKLVLNYANYSEMCPSHKKRSRCNKFETYRYLTYVHHATTIVPFLHITVIHGRISQYKSRVAPHRIAALTLTIQNKKNDHHFTGQTRTIFTNTNAVFSLNIWREKLIGRLLRPGN